MAAKKAEKDWQKRPTRAGVEKSKRPTLVEGPISGRVPRITQDYAPGSAGPENPAPLDGMRVVWVDADPDAAAHGRAVLEAWGAVVFHADGAASGLDTTVQSKPDCVVISLPQGAQVARTLYYMIPNAPPVVLITEFTGGDEAACPGVSCTLRSRYQGHDMLQAMLRVGRKRW
ncbi:MAG: response regulator [Deltaproteobacteria bacterium]|nr:response regulator [Deltaproteobacteria bacterium]